LDQFCKIVEHVNSLACLANKGQHAGDHNVGIAPHSLRAVTKDELHQLVCQFPDVPIHMHVAEQEREVAVCIERYGRRPIEWLLDNFQLNANWCLIHATHSTESELQAVAQCGATICVCPITEANLGDGIFSAPSFLACSGFVAVGSDSNIELSVATELKQLEYSQRLRDRKRNVLSVSGQSTGETIFQMATLGGTRALGTRNTGFKVNAAADFVSLDASHPTLQSTPSVLDGWIFSAGNRAVDCVWRSGKKVVNGGRHIARDSIQEAFSEAMNRLIKN
jgi:formiminoglutamate deiminase